ncbi:MAG: NfeD family protein [Solirubrobacterales bacterium]
MNPALAWGILGIVMIIVELFTAGLWFLWLGIAGLLVSLGLLIHLIPASIPVQLTVFSVITILLIYFTRPIALRFMRTREVQSNVNALVGQTGTVVLEIAPLTTGQVRVGGEIWTARADTLMAPGEQMTVIGVEGVTLRVVPAAK